SLKFRPSKVRLDMLGREPGRGLSFHEFWRGLPSILAVENLRDLIESIAAARRKKKPVLMMFGAHVIKTGLSRYVISLVKSGWVTALATNGAGAIHDFELAFAGLTSEDVAVRLKKGVFGFTRETPEHLNSWAKEAAASGRGLGETIGERIARSRFPNRGVSLFSQAFLADVPITVHAAIGTDTVYQHPACDGAAWGAASYNDFRRFARIVGCLDGGGVAMNWGSAVIMPEIFLKAVAIARNLGNPMSGLTTANFDMISHYRPRVNVLERPAMGKGSKSFNFIGHHELLLPLVAQALAEK
ncbi:MAG: hypothetical protein HY747_05210, partial [Elusimicrobia bacterium]|nr:hypothetical protein [Elusimicrobiota bacterium]